MLAFLSRAAISDSMHSSRLISVTTSSCAIAVALLLGFPGCDKSRQPFDDSSAVYRLVSGKMAFDHVDKMVSFGPRPAGTSNLESSRVYIIDELKKLGWTVQRQAVKKETPEGLIEFVNLRARFGEPDWDRRVEGLVCSHYDTKKFSFPFVGANDGGSSTGLLIEIARVLATKPALAGELELVFFDGEEAFGPNITTTDGLYGSKHYASEIILKSPKERPSWGIVLDMVGDKNLNVQAVVQIQNASIQELKNAEAAGHSIDIEKVKKRVERISQQLLKASNDLNVRSKIGISSQFIIDDHLPLNVAAGIPTIDLIDFDYGNYWHTPADTMDKISAESLEIVGRVTLLLIEKYLSH